MAPKYNPINPDVNPTGPQGNTPAPAAPAPGFMPATAGASLSAVGTEAMRGAAAGYDATAEETAGILADLRADLAQINDRRGPDETAEATDANYPKTKEYLQFGIAGISAIFGRIAGGVRFSADAYAAADAAAGQ